MADNNVSNVGASVGQWWQGRWATLDIGRNPPPRPICCDNEKRRADIRLLLSWASCGAAQLRGVKLFASMKLDLGLDYTSGEAKGRASDLPRVAGSGQPRVKRVAPAERDAPSHNEGAMGGFNAGPPVRIISRPHTRSQPQPNWGDLDTRINPILGPRGR